MPIYNINDYYKSKITTPTIFSQRCIAGVVALDR